MLRKIFLLLTLLIGLLFNPGRVNAITEFSTAYESYYDFTNTGESFVTHKIELTNNLSHIYPTIYNLALSSGNLHDIKVTVGTQDVAPEIDRSTNVTTVHIPIRNPSIGKDQKTIITVTYQSSSFAEVIGDTYTITLPKTAKGNEATSFLRVVKVPSNYPELSYSSISAQTQESVENSRLYRFIGSGDQSLTLHFGNFATYSMTLDYVLKNTTATTATTEIAIPPDTPYQRVSLENIYPQPEEIVVDSDGNWLARYLLDPASKKNVEVSLSLIVSPIPRFFDPSTSSPLAAEKYWEHSSQVRRLATQLKNPRNLYDYLENNLTYDYTQIAAQKRLGAEATLNNPNSAICTEFTDLFVATSRAMGIPSRAIIGYAITSNESLRPQASSQDILHAYPEYLDTESKKWLAVDPTWGHTTGGSEYFERLDFGHIAFVRLGVDPSYPLPAGSYRDPDTPKQIEVKVKSNTSSADEKPTYRIEKVNDQDFLINTGSQAIIQTTLNINNQEVYIPYLPPFGRLTLNQVTPSQSRTYLFPLLLGFLFLIIIYILFYKRWHKSPRQ